LIKDQYHSSNYNIMGSLTVASNELYSYGNYYDLSRGLFSKDITGADINMAIPMPEEITNNPVKQARSIIVLNATLRNLYVSVTLRPLEHEQQGRAFNPVDDIGSMRVVVGTEVLKASVDHFSLGHYDWIFHIMEYTIDKNGQKHHFRADGIKMTQLINKVVTLTPHNQEGLVKVHISESGSRLNEFKVINTAGRAVEVIICRSHDCSGRDQRVEKQARTPDPGPKVLQQLSIEDGDCWFYRPHKTHYYVYALEVNSDMGQTAGPLQLDSVSPNLGDVKVAKVAKASTGQVVIFTKSFSDAQSVDAVVLNYIDIKPVHPNLIINKNF